jgi:epoxyqueuosine reductase
VAAFAQADHYRAAVKALRRGAKKLGGRSGLPQSAFRIFVNSRIPEKLIAHGAGFGSYGRNRLLFHEPFGSRFVIGLLFVPFPIEGLDDIDSPADPDRFCGACRSCIAACPVSALGSEADASLSRCLKTRSDALEVWDEELKLAWGTRFYGCDTCQDACPKNARLPEAPSVGEGVIGPGVDLAQILSTAPGGYRSQFKNTVLDLAWIRPEALLRNALCAAGNSGRPDLCPAVRRHRGHPEPAVADMAAWAERRLREQRPGI